MNVGFSCLALGKGYNAHGVIPHLLSECSMQTGFHIKGQYLASLRSLRSDFTKACKNVLLNCLL